MIKYNYAGKEIILKADTYVSDGHLAVNVFYDDNEDMLSTNFAKKDCVRFLGKDLKANEILICMTPSMEHPIIRGLALDMEENGLLMCWYDFIHTYNEYYRFSFTKKAMEMLLSDEIIEFVPEEEEEE